MILILVGEGGLVLGAEGEEEGIGGWGGSVRCEGRLRAISHEGFMGNSSRKGCGFCGNRVGYGLAVWVGLDWVED